MGPADDGKVEDEYEQSPDFRRFAIPDATFLVLTSIKSALFTAIVTAFVLDAMSDLDENTTTQLLRILVEQSTTNSTVEMPPSKPPSSILTVSSLWFLSIMSSLAATTWAILCLEWCAFLTDGVQAEDYEEMAEKRQRKFEAVKRWKMHLVVAAIPSFLHLSLFLFLAGLWLRLRDVNKQLGLIVGVPSLIIASSYVVVTLLPIFTNAPFSTSASELTQPVFDGIGSIAELRHFIHPPPIFSWIASFLPARRLPQTLVSSRRPRLWRHRLIAFPKRIYRAVRLFVHTLWKTIALLPIIPKFGLNQNPFKELNKLKVGRPDRDRGIHLRALFWLMNTPLSKDEVMGVLEEFRSRGDAGKPLDRTIIRLLVLSLSSVLEDNRVSVDEQPIFDHCTKVLAEEMDRAFGDEEYNQRILFRNTMISEKLSPHFHLTTSDEGTLSRKDYWARAVPALWLCPSTETIHSVVDRLNSDVGLIEKCELLGIVRGLHAAALACFTPNQSTLELVPDFSLWGWDSDSSDRGLDNALSGFLQSLFAAFYTTLPRSDRPITTPTLIIDCLKVFDEQPERYTPKLYLHSALCFFVVVMQRSNPKVFEEGPSVTRALLASAESCKGCSGGNDSRRAKILAARLRAIAYGPKPFISWESHFLKSIGDLHAGLPDSVRTNDQCLEGFIDASAATLEATLAVDGHFTIFFWRRSPDFQSTRNIFTDSLFTHKATLDFVHQNPNSRLPYLYSFAIALSYTTEGRNQGLWRVADLFVTRDGREGITTDRALDINILVVTILRFALYDRSDAVEQERKETFLKSLRNIVIDGTNRQTRWKSIYLIADLARLLSRMNDKHERDEDIKFLIHTASNSWKEKELGCVPSDWEKKKKGLALCELETKVRGLVSTQGEADEGVYEWSGRNDIPYLSLYNPQRTPIEPISNAAGWVLTMFQR